MKPQIRLTKQRAQEIMRKTFCIKNARLERDRQAPAPYDLYRCTLGELSFYLENVFRGTKTLYEVRVSADIGGTIWMYFDPATLEHDYEEEERVRREIREEICENCPDA